MVSWKILGLLEFGSGLLTVAMFFFWKCVVTSCQLLLTWLTYAAREVKKPPSTGGEIKEKQRRSWRKSPHEYPAELSRNFWMDSLWFFVYLTWNFMGAILWTLMTTIIFKFSLKILQLFPFQWSFLKSFIEKILIILGESDSDSPFFQVYFFWREIPKRPATKHRKKHNDEI